MSKELKGLLTAIREYDPEAYRDMDGGLSPTLDAMKLKYERCREVFSSVTNRELMLLWFLRRSMPDVKMLFYDAAEACCNAVSKVQTALGAAEDATIVRDDFGAASSVVVSRFRR